MTTLEQALTGLRDELSSTIMGIQSTRTVSSGVRFKEHIGVDKEQPIFEKSGPARLFEIGIPTNASVRRGGSVSRHEWRIPVTFCYPRKSKWHSVALDDVNQIRAYLGVTHGSSDVAGVMTRRIIGGVDPEIIENAKDPWDYYTVYIDVITETTAS